jgi:hypothetical protein
LGLSDWEKFLERKKANIGFITRGKAFREPTPGEMAQAVGIEIESWQKSKGKKNYKVSDEYKFPKGYGINLKATRSFEEPLTGPEVARAIDAYVNTPMDQEGILQSQGVDLERYKWREIGMFKALWSWITGRKVRRKYG